MPATIKSVLDVKSNEANPLASQAIRSIGAPTVSSTGR